MATAPLNRRVAWAGVGIAFLLPTIVTLVYFVAAPRFGEDAQRIAYVVMKCIQFAFPLLWAWFVERERIAWRRPRWDGIGLGVAFGLVVTAAMWLLYHGALREVPFFTEGTAKIRTKILSFGVDQPWKFIAFGSFYALNHSLFEEYYFRWFLFGRLRRLLPLWPAILLSGIGFMLHHVIVVALYFGWWSWPTALLSLSVAVGGFFWAWLYDRSGSIAGPFLSHLLVDAGIFLVGFDMMRGYWTG
jgi:hypothetical protein